jgi:glutathione S-transferase
MSIDLKLVSHKLCPYVQRARIVLEEKSIPYNVEFIDLADKPQWFLDISPLGKVPVLLVNSRPLFESAAIIEYLDEVTPGSLHPLGPFDRAINRAWIEVASNVLDVIARLYNAKDNEAFASSMDLLGRRFRSVERSLGSGPYFNGASFSLVDAAFAPVFRYFNVIDHYTGVDLFADTPAVTAWRGCLSRRRSVQRAVVGEYPELLTQFLLQRNSILSKRVHSQIAA